MITQNHLQQLRDAAANFVAALDAALLASSPPFDDGGPYNEPVPVIIHPECISHVPEGYDTVLGYLAKHHPEVLECFDYTNPTATLRDGHWLSHRCTSKRYVEAAPILRMQGIETVRAYPLDLLQQRWG